MSTSNTFNLSTAAAEIYESQKVPSIFGPLAKATLEAVSLPENARALDIACGTGIIAKLLTERLPGKGRIVGTDLNPAMVEIAQRTMPDSRHSVEWFVCDAGELPFEDGEFDIAFCQQGLQFFPDKPRALAEIARVLAPNGRLVLTCWREISALFQAVSNSLSKRVSEKSAKQALDPFSFRDGEVIASLLRDAGFSHAQASSLLVPRPLTPARAAIRREILASPYEKELLEKGDEVIDAVVADVDDALEQYRRGESLFIPQEAHLFQAEKSPAA